MGLSANPHAIVFPFPTLGHMNPMFHLSILLASRGFTITYIVSHFNFARSNYPPLPQDKSLDIRLLQLPDGLPPEHGRTSNPVQLCRSVTDAMHTPFEHAIQRLMHVGDPPITCIINDSFVLFIQEIAEKFSIPYVAFWTQSAASYASILLIGRGYRPPMDPSGLITWIPGTPPFKQTEMNTFLQSYDASDFMFYFLTRPFERIAEADWILLNTFHELESETIEALLHDHKISTVGPLLPPPFSGLIDGHMVPSSCSSEDYECLKWLDTHPPSSVLYVAFGSLAIVCPDEFVEFCAGLEASQQYFLWVVRKDLISGDCDGAFPDGFLNRVKDRALFVSWAPQLFVLTHPSLGGFLTHCGWNSTVEAMSAGVPVVGWAYFSDQPMNGRCIADGWKFGLRLETDGQVRRDEVEEKVRRVMERGGELRKTASKWKEAARRAVEEGGSSRKTIDLFVEDMVCRAGVKVNS